MKDFLLKKLFSPTTSTRRTNHTLLKRKLELSSYPIRRAFPLVEESHWTTSPDLNISQASIHTLRHLRTSPRTNDGWPRGRRRGCEGGWIWRRRLRRVMRSLSGKLIFWMLVLVSPFSQCFCVKADVGIIRSGHRDMGNAYNERVSLVKNQIVARLRDRLGE